MTDAAWISLAGVIGQLLVAAFFFGCIRQDVKNLVSRADRVDKRVDAVEARLNDHAERIAALVGRGMRSDEAG
jgi:hypothetical protein